MKRTFACTGTVISGIVLVLMIIQDICQFIARGYLVDTNSIAGVLVILAHVAMVVFFLLFLGMFIKTRAKEMLKNKQLYQKKGIPT